jgi:YfiH family protein
MRRGTLKWLSLAGNSNQMTRAMKTRSSRRGSGQPEAHLAAPRPASRWKIRRARGLQILESPALGQLDWLVHGFSTRPGGESNLDGNPALNLGFTDWDEQATVAVNRAKFAAALVAAQMPLVAMHQFHSDVIHVARAPSADAPKADALLTGTPGLLLGVQTADCVPILLADRRQRAVAAIHAGWRGTLARIVVKTLGRMRMEFGTRSRDIVAALGPAIGRCCYEVGPEVAQAFAAQFPMACDWFDGPFDQLAHGEEPLWLPWLTMMPPGHVPPPPRVELDLRAANRWQLVDAGVPESRIAISDLCTACHTDLLFSYRREGAKTGRMMAAIGIRDDK